MGDLRGFLKLARQDNSYRDVCQRVEDYRDVVKPRKDIKAKEQASRCMDCGTPFCHFKCPLGNYIPEWNDFMFRGNWEEAVKLLETANSLAEITGRVCPALCEYACVLGLNDDPVTIRDNELSVVEYGFNNGLIKPVKISQRTGKKVAVVGSGPAGLSCASLLNKAGHTVTVFERDSELGGILRFGIPDFKLEKGILDRRIGLWNKEGVIFKVNTDVGSDYPVAKLIEGFDAICLAGGSRIPRDLNIEGRNLKGIYFAMDYLKQSNLRVSGKKIPAEELIDARGKSVVVIGGGDTGSDCVGIAHRQKAGCVVQIEVLPRPPECRTEDQPWPNYPLLLRNSSSHEEGGERYWSVLTKKFVGEKGRVNKLSCVKVELIPQPGNPCLISKEIPGSEFYIKADLVIIAAGFLHPQHTGLLKELNIGFDQKGNVFTQDNYATSVDKIFCAGDMRRGQSLVVWAISEGRRCAYAIDKFLMGESSLAQI
ncbi:MAG: glutamate synthase subunit beta [Candidatus Omnitrophica bacterium]|jgi:glutamate synthase (NADPH/NADH) small chain|nr:glutamate synthase subunit beta [Candidatus Omnitrophota bacterium]MDD5664874.1 glutamate synthase subunit beta [Candidatus Omnitrophota bacterium]